MQTEIPSEFLTDSVEVQEDNELEKLVKAFVFNEKYQMKLTDFIPKEESSGR